MSMRWDSLLARHLARELNAAFTGARLRAIRFDARTRDALLFFRDRTLLWRLHPDRGYPLVREAIEPESTDLSLRTRVRGVRAPEDERIIIFELTRERGTGGPYEVIFELLGSQLNAIVAEYPDRTIRHALKTRGGRRPVQIGHPYAPPPPTGRVGADGTMTPAQWADLIDTVSPSDHESEPTLPAEKQWTRKVEKELTRRIAWLSPINAGWLVDAREPGRSCDLWSALVDRTRATEPSILVTERGPQPYPFALQGLEARASDSLLAGFDQVVAEDADAGDAPAALSIGPGLLARLEEAVVRARRRVARLQAQLDGREDPHTMRALGDLILARYADIPASATTVTLTDFDGTAVEVPLDPARRPHDNAARYYDRAGRSERAAERLPALIDAAVAEHDALLDLVAAVQAGTTDAAAVRAALPTGARPQRRGDQEAVLPYRRFRSSGGLEIRVGRGARYNDDLTFRHSAPTDIWLHARHAAGAHVVLRWSGAGAPPARDLSEAGALAALHSKARTSGSVPVDWTLRKYVRKPRGSAPGSVVPERVKTVFVEPDESLLERLAAEDPVPG
jgi:predicted ribosome quality control (RQC) complex YloA/Tae2 family protein